MVERKFENSWRRLGRAAEHLAIFQREWDSLLTKDGFTPVTRYDDDSGWTIASAVPDDATRTKIRNNSLSLILGEYAYQLRAALDGLIWDAFTSINGAEPTTKASNLYFPIYVGDRAKNFQKNGLGAPFPNNLIAWLQSIQPETAEKPEDHPDRGVAGALLDIHDLARFDRHRRLRVIGAVPTGIGFGAFKGSPLSPIPVRVSEWESVPCNVLSGQYDFLRFRVDSDIFNSSEKIYLAIHLTFEVAFEDIQPPEGIRAGDYITSYAAVVHYIIDRFEREFF